MFQINDNFQKLPGSYLFSTIAKKVAAYQEANPDKEIIRLGIGDVTQPLAPAIIDALHKAVDEMGNAAALLLHILFTLYMLIPMSWQEEQAHMMLRKRPGAM